MPGKRVQFDEETWRHLDLLGHDQMKDFQELADEAFRDLLKKYGRPVDLKDALRRSAGVSATVHQLKPDKERKAGGREIAIASGKSLARPFPRFHRFHFAIFGRARWSPARQEPAGRLRRLLPPRG